MIDEELLLKFGVKEVSFSSEEIIFSTHQRALYYYQVKTGVVKMFNLTEDGKEFVQGFFHAGESFAEPPLFGEFPYPASAITTQTTVLYRLEKSRLFELLKSDFETHLKFTETLSKRLLYKATLMKEISVYPAEHRILTLIDYLKEKNNVSELYVVDLTRQQIADLTGLRVETVIRSVKKLELSGELKIIDRKIYR